MRAVNLLPRDDVQRKTNQAQNVAVLCATGAVILTSSLLAMTFLSASGKVKDKQSELDAAQAALALIPPPKTQSDADKQLATEREARTQALATALQRRVAWDRVLRQLSLVLPEDVWLSTLSASAPVSSIAAEVTPPAPSAAPSGLTIEGYTYSHAAVARLLSRLGVIPDLTNVTLARSSISRLGSQKIVQFKISADVRTGGSVS
jgi:Tfp pilus assembly protein PilN